MAVSKPRAIPRRNRWLPELPRLLLGICLLGLALVGCDAPPPPKAVSPRVESTFRHVKLAPGKDADSTLLLEIKFAETYRLTPYVYLSAPWCEPCQALEESWKHPLMQAALANAYIIELNVDEWKKLPTDIKVTSLPEFIEMDYVGSTTGRSISGATWGENTPEKMAPPLFQFFQQPNRAKQ